MILPDMPIRVGGIVLAAGGGVRYGRPKALADDGRWLQAAVSALHGGGCDDVVVVLGAAVVEVPAPARAVVVTHWAEGMSASLRAGVSALESGASEYVALMTVDTPDVGADAVTRVLTAAIASGGLAQARYGRRPGHPVVVARKHWADLVDAAVGDQGGRAFLRRRSDVARVDCADLATGVDIDVSPG